LKRKIGVAKSTSQIAASGANKNGTRARVKALSLNGVKNFGQPDGLRFHFRNLKKAGQTKGPKARERTYFLFMENGAFEKTQHYLMQLLSYLEGIHTSMDWESETKMPSGESHAASDSDALGVGSEFSQGFSNRIANILSQSGYLEGMHLKAQGCLSSDLIDFIRSMSMAFEMAAEPQGNFKLPFVHSEIRLQRKTLNDFMEKAWKVYHESLLSAYSMNPVRFEVLESENQLEKTLRIVEANTSGVTGEAGAGDHVGGAGAAGAGAAGHVGHGGTGHGVHGGHVGISWNGNHSETVHSVNNLLSGILGYVSLMKEERKSDTGLQEKLQLILEATQQATKLTNLI